MADGFEHCSCGKPENIYRMFYRKGGSENLEKPNDDLIVENDDKPVDVFGYRSWDHTSLMLFVCFCWM